MRDNASYCELATIEEGAEFINCLGVSFFVYQKSHSIKSVGIQDFSYDELLV